MNTFQHNAYVSPGTRADYQSLSQYHYRPGHPAAIDQILTARIPGVPLPAAVLVIAYAPLNASWRKVAWPDLLTSSRSLAAHQLNSLVRRIARVIVRPTFRGLGLASLLLRTYLSAPRTSRTEVVASLTNPLFAACGMREVSPAPPPARDQRFAHALRALGIELWHLADMSYVIALLSREPRFATALHRWCNDSRHSRSPHPRPFQSCYDQLSRRSDHPPVDVTKGDQGTHPASAPHARTPCQAEDYLSPNRNNASPAVQAGFAIEASFAASRIAHPPHIYVTP